MPIFKVFADDPSKEAHEISGHMRSVMDDLVCSPFPVPFHTMSLTNCPLQGLSNDVVSASSMFTGEEEVFAFARCCSRLVQMGSKEWAETAGIR